MKKITFSAIAAIAAIIGIIGYTTKTAPEAPNALALANIEALTKIEDSGFIEDKGKDSFIVDGSTTSFEVIDLGDRICYVTTLHIRITCPKGGYDYCIPDNSDIEVSRRCVEKESNS